MIVEGDRPAAVSGLVPAGAEAAMASAAFALSGGDGDHSASVRFGRAGRGIESYALVPPRQPRLLVPAGHPMQAARAMTEFGHHRGGSSQGLRSTVARVFSSDLAPSLHLELESAGEPVARSPLAGRLGEALGAGEVVMALRTVSNRPNAKPVVIVMDPDGEVLGYCKVGTSALTVGLVRYEGEVLTRFASACPDLLEVPVVAHAGPWGNGAELLVTRPVPSDAVSLGRHDAVEFAVRLGQALSVRDQPLGDSVLLDGLRRRYAAIGPDSVSEAVDVIGQALRTIDLRWGHSVVTIAPTHGDFVASNVAQVPGSGRMVAWDWERSRDEAPLAVDAAHYVVADTVRAGRVADTAVPVLTDLFAATGGPVALAAPLVLLDLVEMVMRHEEARSSGVESHDPGYLSELGRLLRFYPISA